jgi:integrase
VTAPGAEGPQSLLGGLMAVVRAEFRSQTLIFEPDDPVFGGGACRVAGCDRHARGHGLCLNHRVRWVKQGRPDLEEFITRTDPRLQRQRPNQRCAVTGCGYGSARKGLCQLHAQRWERAGRPDRGTWMADPPVIKPPPAGTSCHIRHCELWPEASGPFCHSHNATWRANGRPEIDTFAARFDPGRVVPADQSIQLGQLPPQLRLELQYTLQQRRDRRVGKLAPSVVTRVVRLLVASSVASLLDHDEDTWLTIADGTVNDSLGRALLLYARRAVADLAETGGWEAEYPRDVWRMHRLGFDGRRTLQFDRITQPWLRELAKRWVRLRLSSGLGLEAGGARAVVAISRFSRFLAAVGVEHIEQLDRQLLERYLADLGHERHPQRRSAHIGLLNGFFVAIRQHRWYPGLPATALFFPADHPRRPDKLPRALAEQVMAQLEQPANLDRFDNPSYRLITVILMHCGLRVTGALRLRSDCVTTDTDGAPYLRYFNHKMHRDALVPIDTELADAIGHQRRRNTDHWPGGTRILFPRPTKNIDGHHPISSSTYRMALQRWLDACDIRDEHAHRVHLTPHQWRHTLGTRLINRDVPQEIVRRILDHDSPQMTSHYARLHDDTVRRHWEAARKIDITGRTVTYESDGPLADAAWAKQRLARATQALPNGYCGLPLQRSCPHANACLTCPMFLTTSEFLPQHHAQRQQTLELITAAEARGHQRLVEMNRTVLSNLDTIIDTLETPGTAENAL